MLLGSKDLSICRCMHRPIFFFLYQLSHFTIDIVFGVLDDNGPLILPRKGHFNIPWTVLLVRTPMVMLDRDSGAVQRSTSLDYAMVVTATLRAMLFISTGLAESCERKLSILVDGFLCLADALLTISCSL